MSTHIHKTAIIEDGAQIGENVTVGPYSVIGANVILHDNVIIKSHVVIEGKTTIGEGTRVFQFASLGAEPQDLKFSGEESELIIGKNNTIREHATMNTGTEGGGMKTVIGDNGLYMIGTHVAHDCQLGDNVIMANNATLAGHVVVGKNVLIGGLAAVHQFIRIGDYAVIGGMSGVDSDVIPFGLVKGERANLDGLNLVGLSRGGFDKDQVRKIQRAYSGIFADEGTMDERIENVANEYSGDEIVMQIIDFARNKDRFPLCQPQKKKSA